MCCECGVTRLPTNYCSEHVWKERGSKKDEEKGVGDFSVLNDRGYIFYVYTVHMSSQYKNNSLSQSLEQGSDGITHRTLFVTR